MKIILLSIAILICLNTHAQKTSTFDFFIGYGFYEGYNLGATCDLGSGTHSLSLSIGYDKLLKEENVALTLGHTIAIFRNCKNDAAEFKWGFSQRMVAWQLTDESYVWKAVSLIPALNRNFRLYKKVDISLDAGPSFTIVLYSRRKTFQEVGWPYHVMPDFRILFVF